ncbi:unnamed protein product [Clavelina lepadiformis]|uniref:ARID domain-containing protein n=1 Tax=Clavelina lepadiformis TaxID=159417 RepID=A0ABP0G9W6_CLALP
MTTRSHSSHTRANGQNVEMVTWVGGSCGRHGSYIFYKAFRFRVSSGLRQAASTSSVVVRSRARDRRNQVEVTPEVTSSSVDQSDGEERILGLGEFFFVQCHPGDPVCMGEIQLLWHDRHSGEDLASSRFYFLPETTPAGRSPLHGEDEVIAVSEKVVTRVSDLSSWVVEPQEWNYGCPLPPTQVSRKCDVIRPITDPFSRYSVIHASVNMSDVIMEKKALLSSAANGVCPLHKKRLGLGSNPQPSNQSRFETIHSNKRSCFNCSPRHKAQVIILSMSSYCRHKAVMKRIEALGPDWLARPGVLEQLAALGALTSDNPKTRIVFCRDSFDYPQLFEHDLICEELAPVFKGRPRKKTKKGNNLLGSRLNPKKSTGGYRPPTNDRVSTESPIKDSDSATPTRRSSSRRRSKRRSPQNYESHFIPAVQRSNKRARRGSARTPTPVLELEKGQTSNSEPNSPAIEENNFSDRTIREAIEVAAQTAVGSKKRLKKRSGGRSALSIAIKNSLLENHKNPVSLPLDGAVDECGKKRSDSTSYVTSPSVSTSSGASSRSGSPLAELLPNSSSVKEQSRTESSPSTLSSTSNEPYASLSSPSPDFSTIMSTNELDSRQDNQLLTTLEDDMYIRGLSDGQLPDNKVNFLELLYHFMRKRNTPIGRIPSLGFKKLDLWAFFKLSQEYGGYDMVTAKRLWKHVYDRMGGNPSCTSAATCTRKHYEKLLLPFEKYSRQVLRKKDAESKQKKSVECQKTKETRPQISALNGRTFNGDAYFHKVANISQTTSTTDLSMPTKSTNHVATTDSNTDVTLTSLSPSLTEGLRMRASTNSTQTTRPFLEMAHSIIQDNLMAGKPLKLEATSKEIASMSARSDSSSGRSTSEVIDLTSPDHTKKVTSNNDSSSSHSKVSQTTTFTIPTRTYCPRTSGAPPPFVPTRSSGLVNSGRIEPVDRMRPPELPGKEEEVKAIEDQMKLSPAERSSTSEKREHPESIIRPLPSPSAPKPARQATHELSRSNGRYDIRNLVSLPPEEDKRRLNFAPGSSVTKHEAMVPRPRNDVTFAPVQERRSPEQQRVGHERQNHRFLPSPHPADSGKGTREEESRRAERSYYRPYPMLASHREANKIQPRLMEPPNGLLKQDRLPSGLNEERLAKHPAAFIDLAPRSVSGNQQTGSPAQRFEKLPELSRKPFTSSFSVQRLTRDIPSAHPSPQVGLARPPPENSVKVHSMPLTPKLPQPGYHDNRAPILPVSKNRPALPLKKEEVTRFPHDRAHWTSKEAFGSSGLHPGEPSSERAPSSLPGSAILNGMSPSSHFPCNPKEVSPQMLELMMRDAMKSMAFPVAPAIAPVVNPVPYPPAPFDLLRQREATFPFMPQQDPQVVTSQFSRPMLGNPPNMDPQMSLALYQAYALQMASMQPQPGGIPGVAKLYPDLFTAIPPRSLQELRNAAYLPAASQLAPGVAPDAASALAYSLPRR